MSTELDLMSSIAAQWERERQAEREMVKWSTPGHMALALDRHTVQRPHLELIDQAFVDMDAGLCDRMIVTTPPQVGKSSRLVWGVLWWLWRHKRHRVIVASYGADLAQKRGRAVRNFIRDHRLELGMDLAPDKQAAYDWSITAGGGMRTGGLDSGLTGEPGDIGVIDDPVKDRAAADSRAVQENTRDWYSGTFLSRLAPGAPQVIVCTRWAPEDLVGWLLKEEGDTREGGLWRVIHIPAVADPRFGPDPLGRSEGEPCPHPKIEVIDTGSAIKHWQSKRSMSTVRDWAALYQGDPRPVEGALITADQLQSQRYYKPKVIRGTVAVAVDPSGGGRDTAGIIAGFLGADRKLYWTHDRSGVMSSEGWGREAATLAHEIGADRIIAEKQYGGDMVKLTIRTAWEALSREAVAAGKEPWSPAPRVVEVTAKRGKLLRAEPIVQQILEDRIRIAAPLPSVEAEWLDWRPDSNWSPGRIDASVYLAYSLLPIPSAGAVVGFAGMGMAGTSLTGGR